MEMFLEKASDKDIISKIKNDKDWLNVDRFKYLLSKREDIFSNLNIKQIDENILKESLKDEAILISFANIAYIYFHGSDARKVLNESIPRPLNNKIFKNNGILLCFLKEEEYSTLAEKYAKNIKTDQDLNYHLQPLQKYLNETQVLEYLKKNYNGIKFEHLSDQVKTKEVCLYFMNSYFRKEIYKQLPENLKDDTDIAYLACQGDKQFYLKLNSNAQCNERIISYVIDSSIPPAGDYDSYHIDHTAIRPNQLSIEAVLSIKSDYLIKEIFTQNPKFMLDEEIKKKWLGNKKHQDYLFDFYEYFTEENKEAVKNKIKKQNKSKQAEKLVSQPQLRDIIIDESNISDSLELLFLTHKNTKKFKDAVKITKLNNLLENNIETYSKQYMEKFTEFYNFEKIKTIDFSDWLINSKKDEYKHIAIELLSNMLKKDPNALNVDFKEEYNIKSNAVKNIASEVYEYMDSQAKPKAKKKM